MPVWVTACALEIDIQNGVPPYEMVAVGNGVIVMDDVELTNAQPTEDAIVFITV